MSHLTNLFQGQSNSILSPIATTEIKGGKRFLGTFSSSKWSSPEVKAFLSFGSVACIGTNQQMKANLYVNAKGDSICIEW
jgi:hypothetical protein